MKIAIDAQASVGTIALNRTDARARKKKIEHKQGRRKNSNLQWAEWLQNHLAKGAPAPHKIAKAAATPPPSAVTRAPAHDVAQAQAEEWGQQRW